MLFGTTRRSPVPGCSEFFRHRDTRVGVGISVAALAVVAEWLTPLPGLRLLLAVAVIAGPAVLFDRFWRFLVALRDEDIDELLGRRYSRDWRGWRLLWPAFVGVWALDLVATVWFFFVPTVSELHPVTVALYGIAGVPGVLAAGTAYALVAVALVRALPAPRDFDFLLAATLWYGVLVVHNSVLLLGGKT